MQPQTAPDTQTETLNTCHLIVDGNAHRSDLLLPSLPKHSKLICEAMLPQIRTIAIMIAAERLKQDKRTPSIITDEADWFAARILVLQARTIHLDISLKFMLETANRRAETFARKHNLPFTPARIQMSLHANRPANLLIIKTPFDIAEDSNIIENSRRLTTIGHLPIPFQNRNNRLVPVEGCK